MRSHHRHLPHENPDDDGAHAPILTAARWAGSDRRQHRAARPIGMTVPSPRLSPAECSRGRGCDRPRMRGFRAEPDSNLWRYEVLWLDESGTNGLAEPLRVGLARSPSLPGNHRWLLLLTGRGRPAAGHAPNSCGVIGIDLRGCPCCQAARLGCSARRPSGPAGRAWSSPSTVMSTRSL